MERGSSEAIDMRGISIEDVKKQMQVSSENDFNQLKEGKIDKEEFVRRISDQLSTFISGTEQKPAHFSADTTKEHIKEVAKNAFDRSEKGELTEEEVFKIIMDEVETAYNTIEGGK